MYIYIYIYMFISHALRNLLLRLPLVSWSLNSDSNMDSWFLGIESWVLILNLWIDCCYASWFLFLAIFTDRWLLLVHTVVACHILRRLNDSSLGLISIPDTHHACTMSFVIFHICIVTDYILYIWWRIESCECSMDLRNRIICVIINAAWAHSAWLRVSWCCSVRLL